MQNHYPTSLVCVKRMATPHIQDFQAKQDEWHALWRRKCHGVKPNECRLISDRCEICVGPLNTQEDVMNYWRIVDPSVNPYHDRLFLVDGRGVVRHDASVFRRGGSGGCFMVFVHKNAKRSSPY